jgi:hypothetical protein
MRRPAADGAAMRPVPRLVRRPLLAGPYCALLLAATAPVASAGGTATTTESPTGGRPATGSACRSTRRTATRITTAWPTAASSSPAPIRATSTPTTTACATATRARPDHRRLRRPSHREALRGQGRNSTGRRPDPRQLPQPGRARSRVAPAPRAWARARCADRRRRRLGRRPSGGARRGAGRRRRGRLRRRRRRCTGGERGRGHRGERLGRRRARGPARTPTKATTPRTSTTRRIAAAGAS